MLNQTIKRVNQQSSALALSRHLLAFHHQLVKALLTLTSLALLLTPLTSHADFRKALTAYQARDGQTMLKEVQEAVDTKNDDGLVLFLSCLQLDAVSSNRVSINPFTHDINIEKTLKKSTFDEILTVSQQIKLITLLNLAVEKSTPLAKYRLIYMPKFNMALRDEWQKNGNSFFIFSERIKLLKQLAQTRYSPAALDLYYIFNDSSLNSKDFYSPKNAIYWLEKSAQNNNARAAFILGGKYLNLDFPYGCTDEEKKLVSICAIKNENRGFYWIKRAAKYANPTNLPMRDFSYFVSKLLANNVADKNTKQSHLWMILALNNKGEFVSENQVIEEIEKFKNLGQLEEMPKKSVVLPELLSANTFYNNDIFFIYSHKSNVLPHINEKTGSFNFKLFKDGRANFGIGLTSSIEENFEAQWKLSSKKLKQFTDKLNALNIQNWPMKDEELTCMDEQNCGFKAGYMIKFNNNIKLLESNGFNNETLTNQDLRAAQLINLVEEFFPIHAIQCNLGNSKSFNEECKRYFSTISSISTNGR